MWKLCIGVKMCSVVSFYVLHFSRIIWFISNSKWISSGNELVLFCYVVSNPELNKICFEFWHAIFCVLLIHTTRSGYFFAIIQLTIKHIVIDNTCAKSNLVSVYLDSFKKSWYIVMIWVNFDFIKFICLNCF